MSSDSDETELKPQIELTTAATASMYASPEYSSYTNRAAACQWVGIHVAICGLYGTGKKNMMCKLTRDYFPDYPISWDKCMFESYESTGFTYKYRNVYVEFEPCLAYHIHSDNFETIRRLIEPDVRYSDATIIVYDVTDRHSFKAVPVFHRMARTACGVENRRRSHLVFSSFRRLPDIPSARKPIIIMANKCDMPEKDWAVTREEGQRLATLDKATIFMEVSAKTGLGLQKVNTLSKILDQIYLAQVEKDGNDEGEGKSSRIWSSMKAIIDRFLVKIKASRNV